MGEPSKKKSNRIIKSDHVYSNICIISHTQEQWQHFENKFIYDHLPVIKYLHLK